MDTDIYDKIKFILQCLILLFFLWLICWVSLCKVKEKKQVTFSDSSQWKSYPDTPRALESSEDRLKEGKLDLIFLKTFAKCIDQACCGQNKLDVPGWWVFCILRDYSVELGFNVSALMSLLWQPGWLVAGRGGPAEGKLTASFADVLLRTRPAVANWLWPFWGFFFSFVSFRWHYKKPTSLQQR